MNIRKIVSLAIDTLGVVFLFVVGFVLTLIVSIIVGLWLWDNYDSDFEWKHAGYKVEHIGRYKDGKRVGKWEFHIESVLDNNNMAERSFVGRYENGVRQGVWVYRGAYLIYDKGIVRKYVNPLSFKKDKSQVGYYNENVFAGANYAKLFAGILKEYDENGIFIQTREITEQDRQEIADFVGE